MPRALVLHPNGTLEEIALEKGGACKQLQGYVKGPYQLLFHRRGSGAPCTAYVNEEGLMRDMPPNSWGFALASMGFAFSFRYGVRGPVVLVGKITPSGDNGALAVKYVEYLTKIKELDEDDPEAMEALLEYFTKHQEMPPSKRKRAPSSSSAATPTGKKPRKDKNP